MRWIVAVVVMLAGCGGADAPREADVVVAEIREGVPFCGAGATGTGVVFTAPDVAYCEWTCASDANVQRAAFRVDFWKYVDLTGALVWARNVVADPFHARCG